MDQINKENNDTEKLEVGKIFFTNILNISSVYMVDYDAYVKKGNVETIVWSYGSKVSSFVNKYKDSPFLLAMKYLGNGIFEEMVTGEKFITSGEGLIFETSNSHSSKTLDIELPSSVILNYEDYLIENEGEKVLSRTEYVQLLDSCMKRNNENPLLLVCNFPCQEIDENTKKTYLAYSDEERKIVISKAKKIALLSSKEVNEKIAYTIESMKKISNENIEMAYLDNQLFDFNRKKR